MVCDDGLAICSVHCPPGGIASALGKKEVKGVANDCLLVAPAWLLPKQVSGDVGFIFGGDTRG